MDDLGNSIVNIPKSIKTRLVYNQEIGGYVLDRALEAEYLTPNDLDESTKDLLVSVFLFMYTVLACIAYYDYSNNPAYKAIYDLMVIISIYVLSTKVISHYAIVKMVVYRENKSSITLLINSCIEKVFMLLVTLRFIQMLLDMILYK